MLALSNWLITAITLRLCKTRSSAKPPLLLENEFWHSKRNEPKSLERTKAGILLAAGLHALRVAVLARSTAQGRKQNFLITCSFVNCE